MQIIKRQDRQGNLFKKINNLVDDPKRKQYRQNKYVLDRKKKPVEDDSQNKPVLRQEKSNKPL